MSNPGATDDTPNTSADDSTPEAGGGAPDADSGADEGDSDQGTVLATIMVKSDGSYVLVAGDEDDDSAADEGAEGEDEGSEGADEGEGGEAASAGPSGSGDGTTAIEGEEPTKPEDQTFESKGALMAGLLKLLNAHEAEAGNSEESGFDEGYKSAQEPTQKS